MGKITGGVAALLCIIIVGMLSYLAWKDKSHKDEDGGTTRWNIEVASAVMAGIATIVSIIGIFL